MQVTDDVSSRLVRLPLWIGMDADVPGMIVDQLKESLAAVNAR
jgi:hypothetical protein